MARQHSRTGERDRAAQILAEGDTITPDDLPEAVVAASPLPLPAVEEPDSKRLRDVERQHVRRLLGEMKGNKVQTAKALGISRRALYRLLDRYKLDAGPSEGATGAEA